MPMWKQASVCQAQAEWVDSGRVLGYLETLVDRVTERRPTGLGREWSSFFEAWLIVSYSYDSCDVGALIH